LFAILKKLWFVDYTTQTQPFHRAGRRGQRRIKST